MIIPEGSDSNQVDNKLDDQRSHEGDEVQSNILGASKYFEKETKTQHGNSTHWDTFMDSITIRQMSALR